MKSMRTSFLVLSLCFLCGCSGFLGGVDTEPAGHVEIAAELSMLNTPLMQGWQAEIVFSRGRHSMSEVVAIEDGSLTTSTRLPAGTWDISVVLLDNEGMPRFQDGREDVWIMPDNTTSLELSLRPADGQLTVVIDLGDYPNKEDILRVRVHLNDVTEEITRDTPDEPLQATYELAPGSYDFNVALYTSSFRITDLVDPGIWTSIAIEPSLEKVLQWSPAMQDLTIIAEIHTVPPAPPAPSATPVPGEDLVVALEWQFNATQSSQYLVYWQPDPFSPFQLIQESPIEGLTVLHSLPEEYTRWDQTDTIVYSIAPISDLGIVGYRSPAASIDLP